MKKQSSKPRRLSLGCFSFNELPKRYRFKYPFRRERAYVFLGDLANLPGHCVVADTRTGRIYSGYHVEYFADISKDEV